MNTPTPSPPGHGPVQAEQDRFPIYTPEFAADPYAAYAHMRLLHGSLAPVLLHPGVPATLVIGYHTAVRILHAPEQFPADPRIWQQTVPAGCPVLPMLEHRPNALRSADEAHARYRAPNVDAIDNIHQHALQSTVQNIALPLINQICGAGRADLLTQYAHPLAFQGLNAILGCPPKIGQRVAAGMAAIFEGVNAEEGNAMLGQALAELVALKRHHPGMDITTDLLMHPVGLNDVEMLHQLVTLYGAGIEPLTNLIVNTLRLMLSDERYSGDLLRGSLSVRDALDELLFVDPPLANFCVSYPPAPVEVDGVLLPAHQPVVISMAACNNDPAIVSAYFSGNRSHLTWSAGPHACPAQSLAYLIAQVAIEQLVDALPEMELAIPVEKLTYRPGPFHRSLKDLPVKFRPTPPLALA
ncbi:cytochrome P450 [Streptomyces sp. NPDC057623]|uniref:cytochrome P450 n=1 Tax=Streptomyces sp. NPDC057623 TaxID=3346187 RepID=UPI003697A061